MNHLRRKITAAILVPALILSVAACSSQTAIPETESSGETASQADGSNILSPTLLRLKTAAWMLSPPPATPPLTARQWDACGRLRI